MGVVINLKNTHTEHRACVRNTQTQSNPDYKGLFDRFP